MKTSSRLFLIILAIFLTQCKKESKGLENFITRDGYKLMDGTEEFRFMSFNIPNLNFVEDEMAFTKPHAFRLPTSFEIHDALESIKQMGGRVARSYTFPVKRETDTLGIPRYVTGPGEFDENSFKTMDSVLAIANEVGVRLIVPLLNNWKWMGGRPQYAGFRDKTEEEFWTDPQLIEDYKKTIEFVLNRTNTVTGVNYKDDKAVLCWETGNELTCPYSWTKEIVTYMKSIDTNHLVMDGYNAIDGEDIPEESINEDLIDIVTTHHYRLNPNEIIKDIQKQLERVDRKKPYILGEFGFLGTEAILKISDFIIDSDIVGGLIWSLRHHREEGGFYWHSEPLGDDLFKAFHWPGFPSGIEYNEETLMPAYRLKAFQIRGMEAPSIEKPKAPVLHEVTNASEISWKGSAGARYYNVERSESSGGPWVVAGYNVDDAHQIYTPLFNDVTTELGKEYYYRIIAKNVAGSSAPSNVSGPVKVNIHKLIDDAENFTVLYYKKGNIKIETNYDRAFKEMTHRFASEEGSEIIYFVPGNIVSVKVNSFSRDDASSLEFSASANGEDFNPIDAERASFNLGKGDYNYWIPSQYKLSVNGSNSFLSIKINEINQVGRIEIDYK